MASKFLDFVKKLFNNSGHKDCALAVDLANHIADTNIHNNVCTEERLKVLESKIADLESKLGFTTTMHTLEVADSWENVPNCKNCLCGQFSWIDGENQEDIGSNLVEGAFVQLLPTPEQSKILSDLGAKLVIDCVQGGSIFLYCFFDDMDIVLDSFNELRLNIPIAVTK